jgi:alpha-amylase
MLSICFYFQVHQPYRIKRFRVFDIGNKAEKENYFNDESHLNLNNRKVFRKVADKCYLPTNKLMLKLLAKHPEFKISYSFSGIFLDQAEEFYPKVLESFQELVKTGRVEILSETYYHSLAFLYSKQEFKKQVHQHQQKIRKLFGVRPRIFRNTELIYNNDLAKEISKMGYKAIMIEGADHILKGQSPNFLYRPPRNRKIKLLLKNYKLSDDLAFRFSDKTWKEYPLTIHKYVKWLEATHGNGNLINLFMDYETFGEHQWAETGIFKFLEQLPKEVLKNSENEFVTPSEAVKKYDAVGVLDIPDFISWADIERDLSAWRSNSMQHDALNKVYQLEKNILKTKNDDLIESWRRLQTSDQYYYMCTKWFNDGDVHKYFNPYESPYEAFIAFMNVYQDLNMRMKSVLKNKKKIKKNTTK